MKLISTFILAILFSLSANAADVAIQDAVNAKHRNADNVIRDQYRHPAETLEFFGISPDMYVLEILPGRGWYTEILAPLLKENGQLTLASFGADHPNNYLKNIHNSFAELLQSSPELYGKTKMVVFEKDKQYLAEVPDNSQDMILTFRSTHNWIRYGGIESIYQAIYRVLKKGAVLGVVQHRANAGSDSNETAQKGYVTEEYLINLLEGMGFELAAKSEINANPKDTKDYKDGVWTLPPSLRAKDGNEEKYKAIGESDRMTLRFIKL
ncbi:MAG: methyltransferase [Pseudomonadota bacterium]